MVRKYKYYAFVCLILLALFNVIVFVIPNQRKDDFTSSFWIGYCFAILVYILNLVISYLAFKSSSAKKFFYGISLITISFTTLIFSFLISLVWILVPVFPDWLEICACSVILALYIISIIKVIVVKEIVESVDERIETQTEFVKRLILDAERQMAMAKSEAVKRECKKIYEAARYSDPVSNEKLSDIENAITYKINSLYNLIDTDDSAGVSQAATEIINLIKDRNMQCKLYK